MSLDGLNLDKANRQILYFMSVEARAKLAATLNHTFGCKRWSGNNAIKSYNLFELGIATIGIHSLSRQSIQFFHLGSKKSKTNAIQIHIGF